MSGNSWNKSSVQELFDMPVFELVHKAYSVHKENFNPQNMEYSTLSNIKTGGCPEDCTYCPQSVHYQTGLKREKLLDRDTIIEQAKQAKKNGAKRFCMGAAWRSPPKKGFQQVLQIIQDVKSLELETCVTLGLLNESQANELKSVGLDFYNHNLDTSRNFTPQLLPREPIKID